ncbi:MAG: hypothetical protein KDA73_16475 [Rhodobacteraceae bacterium]|nr:hypothetical protein [Paracoccaceae bacterium]
MDAWPDRQPMRAAALALAAGICLTGTAGAQTPTAMPGCPAPRLELSEEAGARLQISVRAPCHPYAPVVLTLGALRVSDETGIDGELVTRLPRLPGATSVAAEIAGSVLTTGIPAAAAPASPFAIVIWPDPGPWGALVSDDSGNAGARRLGFPFPQPHQVADLLDLASGGAARIDVPVTSGTCGRILEAELLTPDHPAARTVRVTMPDCLAEGQGLRVPLAP